MGNAPDKPDPTGLIQLATNLYGGQLGEKAPPIAYVGDTVADVITVINARESQPQQTFLSLGVAPPHLHKQESRIERLSYEKGLINAGADKIITCTKNSIKYAMSW